MARQKASPKGQQQMEGPSQPPRLRGRLLVKIVVFLVLFSSPSLR